ncbi:hypothetical protein KEJ26_04800 [Candidatus Bathyarchaeota archaeon]|nr:hypothetical protein [Candidatus Bathyarchaeota archaeon]
MRRLRVDLIDILMLVGRVTYGGLAILGAVFFGLNRYRLLGRDLIVGGLALAFIIEFFA